MFTELPHSNCYEYDCWSRIKHYCICGKTGPNRGGVQGPRVVFCEDDLKRIWEKSGSDMGFLAFSDLVTAEALRAADEAWPSLVAAQIALSSLSAEQSLISIRFCVRLGPIRICVEWLL